MAWISNSDKLPHAEGSKVMLCFPVSSKQGKFETFTEVFIKSREDSSYTIIDAEGHTISGVSPACIISTREEKKYRFVYKAIKFCAISIAFLTVALLSWYAYIVILSIVGLG